ncbi:MAG: hypothetical protein NTX63_05240, partial [Candidatus Peregrinibacteria bacterium]|nr:hypothetical protein [Candidatus Peregrinibacteria bacterium]
KYGEHALTKENERVKYNLQDNFVTKTSMTTGNVPKGRAAADVVVTGVEGARETVKKSLTAEETARGKVFEAMMKEVREEIEIVFGGNSPVSTQGMDSRENAMAMERGVSVEKFMRDGTTLIARNPVDVEGAANGREYVLPNNAISKKGSDVSASESSEESADQGQSPLDLYMAGLKHLAEKLFRNIKLGDLKNHEIKVVATDAPDVDELKRAHVTIQDGLAAFTPPKASSKGKE